MSNEAASENRLPPKLDVLIVGAGLSGIAAAHHLRQSRPGSHFALVDEKDTFGGTWDTHRYPGARSDSDLYTFGFSFKPWIGPPIATRAEILQYIGEAIEENNLRQAIHYGWRVEQADWDSKSALWTVDLRQHASGQTQRVSACFLWMCQGYFHHDQGYTPNWPGLDNYQGELIHPQNWPEDFDGTGKRVVVIGSGATAATLLPNIADDCEHVTMLQRSPTYFIADRNAVDLADTLRKLEVDEAWVHEIVRRQRLFDQAAFMQRCKDEPEVVKQELLAQVRQYVGPNVDIERHFTPSYRPWQQRLAFIPNGDLFQCIADGRASVVTDHIEQFTENGIQLQSGETLDADTVITATGFDLCVMGDIRFSIDGKPFSFNETITYRGMMFTGVPNLVWVFGYFRASWTLRAELVARFVCRLLDYMEEHQKTSVEPALRPSDQDMPIHS